MPQTTIKAIKDWLPVILVAAGLVGSYVNFKKHIEEAEPRFDKIEAQISAMAVSVDLTDDKIIRLESEQDHIGEKLGTIMKTIDKVHEKQDKILMKIFDK